MKAIHNRGAEHQIGGIVVLNDAKLEILKAIHNTSKMAELVPVVVLNDAKLEILKAIHNLNVFKHRFTALFLMTRN